MVRPRRRRCPMPLHRVDGPSSHAWIDEDRWGVRKSVMWHAGRSLASWIRHQGSRWVRLDRRLHLSYIVPRDLGTKVHELCHPLQSCTSVQHLVEVPSSPLHSLHSDYQWINCEFVIQYNMQSGDVAMICLTSCVFPFFFHYECEFCIQIWWPFTKAII